MAEERLIPEQIRALTDGKPYRTDHTGMSGSEIRIYEDFVLKIDRIRGEDEETVRVMRWLEGKIPVPRVLYYEKDQARQYLLMTRVQGEMSCSPYYLEHPRELLALLAEGLKMLWAVDLSGCPRSRDLDTELKEAKDQVEKGLVSMDRTEPGTFGPGGFKDPEELLKWLEEHRPSPEPVLSHGDYCLPNIFLKDGQISGFIDLGSTGIGDRWRDIALCWRSLKHNFDGTYGGKVYPDFHPDMLFDALGIAPDAEKLRYYILLDELF